MPKKKTNNSPKRWHSLANNSKANLSDMAETFGGGYYALAAAIIHRAVQDYENAAKSHKRNRYVVMKRLEDFFLSDWGQTLSLEQGAEVVRLCRQSAREIIADGKQRITQEKKRQNVTEAK